MRTSNKICPYTFKCVPGCPTPYIVVVLLEHSDFCLQLTVGQKYMVFQSQSTMTVSRV